MATMLRSLLPRRSFASSFSSIYQRPSFSTSLNAATSSLHDVDQSSNSHNYIKARLDYKTLVKHVDTAIENVKKRCSDGNPQRVVELYQQQVKLRHTVNVLRNERNKHAKELQQTTKTTSEAMNTIRRRGQTLKQEILRLETELTHVSTELELEALKLPNNTHPNVPIGGVNESQVVSIHGERPTFNFPPQDHADLGLHLRLFDTQLGAKVAESKFTYLCNEGAMMELALIHYTLTKLQARGFTIIFPPDVAHEKLIEGCGFQPRGEATQMYSLANSNLCLTATSEITLAAMKSNQVIPTTSLPLKYAGLSHCFRTEIGHGGRLTRGIYRIHQFSKVEMFGFCANEFQSQVFFDEMVEIEMEIYTELGLHYQIVNMATSELGAPAYRKYDFLAWMPGRQTYGEVSSISMCTDYQARRLNIRHKDFKKHSSETTFFMGDISTRRWDNCYSNSITTISWWSRHYST
ncbi:putative serine-tRNA ligase, type1, class I and II aminoacyl-tRNA synthetase, tRNA-binding arm [Plasmopara halstedii]